MKSKSIRYFTVFCAFALVLTLVGVYPPARAAEKIFVNNSSDTLDMDITAAYAVGSGGSVETVGDTYVLTGSGVVKLGQSTAGKVPSGDPDGTTIGVSVSTAKIGLYYYYSAGRDTALASANLENVNGAGYQFGYYDEGRVFHEQGNTAQTKITMQPTGSGREVSVYVTGTSTVVYTHKNANYNLAVRPVSASGKAVTLFKNNTYYGDFEYYRYVSNKLTVINVVNLEDYIKGVVTIEMSSSWPAEALKAQALCARTYFARNINSYSKYGFDITADTYSQAYLGAGRSTAASDAAVDATAGEYVTYNGAFCDTLYYSSNGGGSEDSENVFVTALPYLRGVVDPYEASAAAQNSYSAWTKTYSKTTLSDKITAGGKSFGAFASMNVTYSATGNAIGVSFTDTSGKTVTYARDANWSFFCSRLGLPSIHFTCEDNGGNIVFTGGGWGHNVGMSQWGAYAMAQYHGFNYRQILRYYYTGISISKAV